MPRLFTIRLVKSIQEMTIPGQSLSDAGPCLDASRDDGERFGTMLTSDSVCDQVARVGARKDTRRSSSRLGPEAPRPMRSSRDERVPERQPGRAAGNLAGNDDRLVGDARHGDKQTTRTALSSPSMVRRQGSRASTLTRSRFSLTWD
jgi:hypothetical protein